MTLHNLLQAIHQCDNNGLDFNLGSNRAFLFGKKWYPLRATVNRAKEIANEDILTTDRALVELVYLGLWNRIADIEFNQHLPVDIDQDKITNEIGSLAKIIFEITK